jgi:hypothetical protein
MTSFEIIVERSYKHFLVWVLHVNCGLTEPDEVLLERFNVSLTFIEKAHGGFLDMYPLIIFLGRFMYHLRVTSLRVPKYSLHFSGSTTSIIAGWVDTAIKCSKGSDLPSNVGKWRDLKFSGTWVSQISWANDLGSSNSSSNSSSVASLVQSVQLVPTSVGFGGIITPLSPRLSPRLHFHEQGILLLPSR